MAGVVGAEAAPRCARSTSGCPNHRGPSPCSPSHSPVSLLPLVEVPHRLHGTRFPNRKLKERERDVVRSASLYSGTVLQWYRDTVGCLSHRQAGSSGEHREIEGNRGAS